MSTASSWRWMECARTRVAHLARERFAATLSHVLGTVGSSTCAAASIRSLPPSGSRGFRCESKGDWWLPGVATWRNRRREPHPVTAVWWESAPSLIDYRPFLNCDPPELLRVWRVQSPDRGLMQPMSHLLLELFVLAKPYFDRPGLI